MKHLIPLNKYFYKYKSQFIIGMFCTIIANYIAILSPQFTVFIIDKLTFKNLDGVVAGNYNFVVKWIISLIQKPQQSFQSFVIFSTVVLLLLAVLRGLFMFIMRQTIIVGSRQIEYDLKNDVYAKYQNLDLEFYKKNLTGDLMNRISEDVSKVRMYAGPAVMYVINMLVLLLFSVYFMFKTNAVLAIISLSPLPILAYIIYKLNVKIQHGTEQAQQDLSTLTVMATETYSGIRVIQSFVQEKIRLSLFDKASKQYQTKMLKLAKLESFYFPSMTFLIGVSTLLTIAVGGIMVVQKIISVSIIVEFVMYINMLIFPVSSIGWIASIIQSAAASQKRLNEFMAINPFINQTNKNAISPILNGNILFKNVNFTYQNTNINAIKNFNLQIKQGQKIALMGKMACGKSTLVQLLMRSFDINNGNIQFDGNDIQQIDLKHLRNHIHYIPQDSFIFSDTIKNNLLIAEDKKISNEELINNSRSAELYDEIMKMPQQWDTLLGERGINLSGGQKQRLAIARTLMSERSIYIFDDSFSAIDMITEKKIIQTLSQILEHKTLIFITHRVYEDIYFDNIVIIENGTIAEQGKHEELMKNKHLYYNIFNQKGTSTIT